MSEFAYKCQAINMVNGKLKNGNLSQFKWSRKSKVIISKILYLIYKFQLINMPPLITLYIETIFVYVGNISSFKLAWQILFWIISQNVSGINSVKF